MNPLAANLRVLGIDPGSLRTGWGIVEFAGTQMRHVGSGIIDLRAHREAPRKLAALVDELDALVRTHSPNAVGIEKVFHGKNAKSALTLGQARGAALSVVGRYELTCLELAPSQVKVNVTGHGSADKDQVMAMVQRLLNMTVMTTHDESDALALAIAAGAGHRTPTQDWMTQHGVR